MLQIQEPERFDPDKNYFEVRVHLDWLGTEPAKLRPLAVPVELSALMPLTWDIQQIRNGVSLEPQKYFGLKEADPKALADVRPMGGGIPPSTAPFIRSAVRRIGEQSSEPVAAEALEPLDGNLRVVPFKLLITLSRVVEAAVDEPESFDALDLVIDKVTLLMLMPKIAELLTGKVQLALAADPPESRFHSVLEKLESALSDDPGLNPASLSSPSLFNGDTYLEIPKAEWREVLKVRRSDDVTDTVWLTLSSLEHWLNAALKERFDRLVEGLGELKQTFVQEVLMPSGRTAPSYRDLYRLVDRLWTRWSAASGESFNAYKLGRRDKGPRLLPVIESIDARPQVWAREAEALSLERALATRACALLLQRTFTPTDDKALGELHANASDLRAANRTLFELRRSIEGLNQEVSSEGYVVRDTEPRADLAGQPGLRVVRRVQRTRLVVTPREAAYTWTENHVSEVCNEIRHGPLVAVRRCHPVYWSRTITQVRKWYETVVEQYIEDVPISVDWNPIETYLRATLPKGTTTVRAPDGAVDQARSDEAREFVRRVLGRAPGEELANGHKDVRIFELYENGYRDQRGFSLDYVLREAEGEHARAKLLLVIPLYERRIDGSMALMKYIAVHNPIGARRSYGAPRVFLLEQYVNSFSQVPGHWIGALSHTVCLFPGEQRRIKIATETRLVSQQRQESRTSQRTAVESKSNVRSQIRLELSDQQRDAKQNNWSANVSGGATFGFGKVSGSAKAGGSREASQEKVAKSLNDRVEEALSAISTQNEVQFATSSDIATTQSSSSEQTIEISNVNQGRAVTHKFFQILHCFTSKVEFEGARLLVEYPEPIIPGVDLFKTEVVPLADIDKMFPELIGEDREKAQRTVRELVKQRLGKFASEDKGVSIAVNPGVADECVRYVNSGAYFVDTEVARMPATEPYVEDARQAEIELQKARASKLNGEAQAIEKGKWVVPLEEAIITVQRAQTAKP